MAGFLQKLGILAEDDAAPSEPVPSPTALPSSAPVSLKAPAAAPAPMSTGGDGTNEAKVLERLTKALEEADLPGLDFFEFQKALRNAQKMLPGSDEATRYSVAFGTLAAVGSVTPEAIATSADHYIKALEDKQASFTSYIEGQVKDRVTAKVKETENIRAQIQAKNDQIKTLSEEIVKLTQASVEAQNSAAQAKAELEAYAQTFCNIKDRFIAEIQQAKQKFVSYIMSGTAGH